MQLPGMSTEPVRLALDVTWDPIDSTFSFSRRLWTRCHGESTWQLEDMACSGTPVRWLALPDRWSAASSESLRYFTELVKAQSPFPE